MMSTIYDFMKEYKNCSVEILNCIENEEFELLNGFFDKRTIIINRINEISYSQEEFIECCKKYEIVEIENDIDMKMKLKRNDLLEKIKNISTAKTANNSYNRIYNEGAIFFSKKI